MSAPGDDPHLAFHWQDDDRPVLRLLIRLFLALVGVAGFFLLFQVVYPLSRPSAMLPQSILVLSPADPNARSLLSRVSDESPLRFTRPADDLAQPSMQPVFQPSFTGSEMKLKSASETRPPLSMPRLFDISQVPLPPLPQVKKPAGPAAGQPQPRRLLAPVLHGPLASRQLVSPPSLAGIQPLDAPSLRFRISVDGRGIVAFALPVNPGDDREAVTRLQRALSAMRFAPAAAPLQWGDVTFRWQPQPPQQP